MKTNIDKSLKVLIVFLILFTGSSFPVKTSNAATTATFTQTVYGTPNGGQAVSTSIPLPSGVSSITSVTVNTGNINSYNFNKANGTLELNVDYGSSFDQQLIYSDVSPISDIKSASCDTDRLCYGIIPADYTGGNIDGPNRIYNVEARTKLRSSDPWSNWYAATYYNDQRDWGVSFHSGIGDYHELYAQFRYYKTLTKIVTYKYNVTVQYTVNEAPNLVINNAGNKTINLKNGSNNFTISGTVSDVDNDTVTISASVGGVYKSITVGGTSTLKSWSLSWNTNELTSGAHNVSAVTATDSNGGQATAYYSGVVTVDKTPLYYWDKYDTKDTYERVSSPHSYFPSSSYPEFPLKGHEGYEFNGDKFSVAGNYTDKKVFGRVYQVKDNGKTLLGINTDGINVSVREEKIVANGKQKNSLIQSNIYDLDGTYPDNGLHHDGYWYVKKAVNNAYPVVTINQEDKVVGLQSGQFKISGTVYDSDNDTVIIRVSIGGVTKTTSITSTTPQLWELIWLVGELNEGEYDGFSVFADDGKGGIFESKYSGKIMLDKTPPAPPVIDVSTSWTNGSRLVTVEPSIDGLSGTMKTEYRLGSSQTWLEYQQPFEITAEGSTAIIARSIDRAGNISVEATSTAQIDKTDPLITITPNKKEWTSNPIDIEIKFEDALSDIDLNETKYKVTNSVSLPTSWDTAFSDVINVTLQDEGEWYVHAKAMDNAGNTTSVTSQVIQFQNKPEVPNNLKVSSVSDTEVQVTWDLVNSSFTDGYQYILENTTTGQIWNVQHPTQLVVDDQLQAGSSYSYRIKSKNYVGESSYSQTLNIMTLPGIVNNITITPADRDPSHATLNFDSVRSADRYHIQVRESLLQKISYEKEVTSNINQVITNLNPGTQYIVTITPENVTGKGKSAAIGFLSLPDAPGEFKFVQIKEEEIYLGWNSVTSATYYELQRDLQTIYGGQAITFLDDKLQSGTEYDYQVSAKNSTGYGDISFLPSLITLPGTVTVTGSTYDANQVHLKWETVRGSDKYVILVDGKIVGKINKGITEYTIKGLDSGSNYLIELYAENRSGTGSHTTINAITLPDKPVNLHVSEIGETKVTLNWNKVNGALRYRVTLNNEEYIISDNNLYVPFLKGGEIYKFKVEAWNESGYGLANEESFLTLPSEPGNIRVTQHNGYKLQLEWDKVPSAKAYLITQDGIEIGSVSGTSLLVKNLTPGSIYNFNVVSVNDTGKSQAAPFIWRTVPDTDQEGQVWIESRETNSVILSWDAIEGADEYEINVPGIGRFNTSETTIKIDGLESSTVYTGVLVTPVNTTGYGSDLIVQDFETLPSGDFKVKEEIKGNVIDLTLEIDSKQEIFVVVKDGKEVYRGLDREVRLDNLPDGAAIKIEVWTENNKGDRSVSQKFIYYTPAISTPKVNGIPISSPNSSVVKETPTDAEQEIDLDNISGGRVFDDIDGLYNENQVMALWYQDIVRGSGKFEPKRDITRAEFMAMIVRALELKPRESAEMRFKDIDENAWYYKELKIAHANKVVDGFSEIEFRPNATLTREQASKMLANILAASKSGDKVFKDQNKIAYWAEKDVKKLALMQVVEGYADGTFKPKNRVNRAEGVAFIYKFMKLESTN